MKPINTSFLSKLAWFARAIIYKLTFRSIGSLSYIGRPLFIHNASKISLGDKVRIFPHSRMEVHGKDSLICIKDNVSIGQNLHIISGAILNIGSNTTLSANVFISNINHDYKAAIDVHAMNQPLEIKDTSIGSNCFIGFGAVILPGTTLGDNCIVGANSVVTGEFPSYSIIAGAPARVIKSYDITKNEWITTNKGT